MNERKDKFVLPESYFIIGIKVICVQKQVKFSLVFVGFFLKMENVHQFKNLQLSFKRDDLFDFD